MYLKRTTNKKTGRTYLSMVRKYHDPEKKCARETSVEPFGYLDELEKAFDDPIAHFRAYVERKNREEKAAAAEHIIKERKDTRLKKSEYGLRKCIGHAPIAKVFRELGLESFFNNRQRGRGFGYSTAKIMELLVTLRILSPGSKRMAYNTRKRYFGFEKDDPFSLDDIYRALSHFADISGDVQRHVASRISKQYGRDTSMMYYDVTNYWFETDKEDGFKAKGPSKEHRPDPIVQMGLAMDADGIPIAYDIFAGNESEKLHFRPMVFRLRNEFEGGKIIAVADAAQNTGNNIYYLESGKCSYVFSQSIRGGDEDLKAFVLSESGYEWFGEEYMRKSRPARRKIRVERTGLTEKGNKRYFYPFVDQRQIVFYSEKYAARQRAKREIAIKKAYRIIADPAAYSRATSFGALKYIQNVEVDEDTGEIKVAKAKPFIDFEAIEEEKKYDGYYCIVTNIFDEDGTGRYSDDKMIDMYHGLWKIEDTFKVTKSDLKTRPVFVWNEKRIRGHFLTCFVALVILRLIEKRMGREYTASQIIDAMKNICCSPDSGNLFLFDYRTDVTDALGEAFGIDFTRKRLSRAEIKNILATAKQV
jgi:transposase